MLLVVTGPVGRLVPVAVEQLWEELGMVVAQKSQGHGVTEPLVLVVVEVQMS